jgi:uncharacterized membrane protein
MTFRRSESGRFEFSWERERRAMAQKPPAALVEISSPAALAEGRAILAAVATASPELRSSIKTQIEQIERGLAAGRAPGVPMHLAKAALGRAGIDFRNFLTNEGV